MFHMSCQQGLPPLTREPNIIFLEEGDRGCLPVNCCRLVLSELSFAHSELSSACFEMAKLQIYKTDRSKPLRLLNDNLGHFEPLQISHSV
jgi:hypothetical protein